MDEDNGLDQLDPTLRESLRCITITPRGHDISGWSKAEAVLLVRDLADKWEEEVLDELTA